MSWVDDFDGERVNVEELTDERLAEIRASTLDAMEIEGSSRWAHQLEALDEEIDARRSED